MSSSCIHPLPFTITSSLQNIEYPLHDGIMNGTIIVQGRWGIHGYGEGDGIFLPLSSYE